MECHERKSWEPERSAHRPKTSAGGSANSRRRRVLPSVSTRNQQNRLKKLKVKDASTIPLASPETDPGAYRFQPQAVNMVQTQQIFSNALEPWG
jgi:hypothetical protein